MTIESCLNVLGITGKPTKAAIRKAFRQAAIKHHPDTQGTDDDFIRIKAAYDTLMALSSDELSSLPAVQPVTTAPSGTYDPFDDPLYATRAFFEPENPNTEGFERKLRAKHCPYCQGYGFFTKNTVPARGFLGRERRLCKCQWA